MALSDGLVGCWSPWLGSSGYRLLDRTRFANHGTLTGMDAGTDWVGATIQGRSGYALDFDGANDFVEIPHQQSLNLSADLTIAMWIYPKSSTAANRILISKNAGNATTFELYLKGLTPYWWDNSSEWSSNLTLELNKWSHLAVTRTGKSIVFYLNYVSQRTVIVNNFPTTNTNPVQIGRDPNGQYFLGAAADISLHSRMIGNGELLNLYRLGPGWYQPYAKRSIGYAAAGFKAYWHRRQSHIIGGGLR